MSTRREAWRAGRNAWARLSRWAAERVDGEEALTALDDIGTLRRLLDSAELDAVRLARLAGRSWAEIATRLGITRQAAWERWRELDEGLVKGDDRAAAVAARAAAEAERTGLERRKSVKVPNVIAMTWDEARAKLIRAELAAVRSDPDAPPLEPSEWSRQRVTDQSPESGAKVRPGTVVRLWLDADDGGSGVREPRRPIGPRPKAARELKYDTDLPA